MQTIKRLVISPRPITPQIQKEQYEAAELMRIPDILEIETDFLHIQGILKNITTLKNGDIDKRSIQKYVSRKGYYNIHLVLNERDWRALGIRQNLYGQSQEIDGQVITYGRWSQRSRYKVAHKYEETFLDKNAKLRKISDYTEHAIGVWHEVDHGTRRMLGIEAPATHYHFYGYAGRYITTPRAELVKIKPKRFVRKPDPLAGWRALPFEYLKLDKVQKEQKTLIGLLQQAIKLFGLVRIKQEQPLLKDLQPAVKRKAEALIAAMADNGYLIDITSGYRGVAEQNALYAKGRTTKGKIITNAKYGNSLHNYGVAFDVAFMVKGKPSWSNKHPWELLGSTGEALGLEWGGRWTSFADRPHFEYKAGYTLSDFINKRVDYKKFK